MNQVTEGLRALRDQMDGKRTEFDAEQTRAAELIKTRFDDSVRRVFLGYQAAIRGGLEELDRDMDLLVRAFLDAIDATYQRTEAGGRITYQISSSPSLPEPYRNGGTFLIGRSHDLSEGEPLHPGHSIIHAAVDEARQATAQPLDEVELAPGDCSLPPCFATNIGRRGRLVVTRVAYRGLEAFDHLLVTALLQNEHSALPGLTIQSLMGLSIRDVQQPQLPLSVDDRDLAEAIEEAVLEDQSTAMTKDEDRFNRRLEQLDRYLDDQVLVYKRKRAVLERKLVQAESRKQGASAPSLLTEADRVIRINEREISRLSERIDSLEQGEDADYQHWRARLYERRFQKPTVERILELNFRVAEGG
jgi:hypothetical protein